MPADSPIGALQALFRSALPVSQSLTGLGVIVAVCLWLAARTVARREFVLEQ